MMFSLFFSYLSLLSVLMLCGVLSIPMNARKERKKERKKETFVTTQTGRSLHGHHTGWG
jgi:hypothetical protein